ncbi:MAG TPA: glycerophosphodiester phosphodiesterase, partial [Gemmatimonadaceae bacterium]
VVVVHHDELAAGLALASADWADVSAIRLAGGARIPRLEDVLTTVAGEATVYIELKGRDVEAAALDIARRHGKRYAVHSFDHAAVERARALAPEVPRGVLLDRGTADPIMAMEVACRRVAPRDVWPHSSLVDAAFMKAAATLSVRVIVWTVNSRSEAARLNDLGVAGLCTDDVRILANP